MPQIRLTTLNARYIHSAFGLRYLYANLGELKSETEILEFGIQDRPIDIVEKLLQHRPKIIGFGVYIWNVAEIGSTVALLKQVAPEIVVILGGPEVSHPPDLPPVAELADYIVTGVGEISFRALCEKILNGEAPDEKIITGVESPLESLASPYLYYNDEDVRNRIVYVEASRGCPFKCEFCLSALDVTAKPFALDRFLDEMEVLYRRGVRHFKFIDRTFNLKIAASVAILEFFLERMSDDLFLHFEVIPDHLPDRLKQTLEKFPPATLQFEVGVQTFDPAIQQLISRRQDNEKTKANLRWLKSNTHAHIHADLIFGLPGDTLANFAASFNQLAALQPHEIQLGILKRLRGAPLNRHNETYRMRYNPEPPYNILSTRDIGFNDMQRINRFARYWDMIGNSGRFAETLPLILADAPFERFLQLSDALYELSGSTWKIALRRMFDLLYRVMTEFLAIPTVEAIHILEADYRKTGEKGLPSFMKTEGYETSKPSRQGQANKRQQAFGHS
ncbi:B12-binding domain-containing radical SAM protein [Methylotuvimicrobium buryatense]|uniref:B12-binding domain-containing radical SAM protein n=1 Tax=Methylotuvimicrobium buryatense TaxID=95641 RepID=A0A4P9UMT4_METBY|nr:B12-binding domain-containing radical SAM protein [Methylotuvimicrobium buryatense]QCW81850.1 B12-binding domain-containing radical SAM protein [Methylotuvimicrobium buryatense]